MNPRLLLGLALILAAGSYAVLRVPRGIRNNNPGNLVDAGIPWRGLIGSDETGKAVFRTALEGIRAMYIDLRTGFERDREDTVREIITEWSATDREPYIKFISRFLGVGPDEPLELASVRVPLIKGITQFENGQQPYSDELINAAIAAA